MTASGDSVSKHATITGYLSEQMSVARMVEALEGLQFNSHEEAKIMIDPGVQAFLIRATRAAADHLDQKVRHTWRLIRPPR